MCKVDFKCYFEMKEYELGYYINLPSSVGLEGFANLFRKLNTRIDTS